MERLFAGPSLVFKHKPWQEPSRPGSAADLHPGRRRSERRGRLLLWRLLAGLHGRCHLLRLRRQLLPRLQLQLRTSRRQLLLLLLRRRRLHLLARCLLLLLLLLMASSIL